MRKFLLLFPLLLTACAGDAGAVVEVDGHTFRPDNLTVDVGQTVTFSNDSGEPHTFTGDGDDWPDGAEYLASGGSSSEEDARGDVTDGLLTEGETFEIQGFDVPGTYRFFCIPHEADGMAVTIVVR